MRGKDYFKKELGLLLCFVLIIGILPLKTQAISSSAYVTECRTSYNEKNYVEYSLGDNSLTVSGICDDPNVYFLGVYLLVNYETDPINYISISPNQHFSQTFSLTSLSYASEVNVITATYDEQQTYMYNLMSCDILRNGSWYFEIDPDVLKNNISLRSDGISPSEALSTASVDPELASLSDSIVEGAATNYEKLKKLHDWVADNIYYDYDYYDGRTSNTSQEPLEVLESKRTVCAGYSYLLQHLLWAQGIPCFVVYGNASIYNWMTSDAASDSESHAWNQAWADGRWINIDVTWDSQNTYKYGVYNHYGIRDPLYFDVSDEMMSMEHSMGGRMYVDKSSDDEDDAPSSWAQEEVNEAISLNLIPDSLQSTYQESITRSDFCKLVIRLLETKKGDDIDTLLSSYGVTLDSEVFSDCSIKNVNAAYALGIVSGKGNGIFDPNGSITRQEAAAMLYRAAQKLGMDTPNGQSIHFNDSNSFSSWAAAPIEFISAAIDGKSGKAVMGGVGNGNFSPTTSYTREQSFCTILRLFDAIV